MTDEQVWVEFNGYWNGYKPGQRRLVGRHYRKMKKELAEKMPKSFSYKFSDNSINDWAIKPVSKKGKNEGVCSEQIDEFMSQFRK